MAQPKVRFSFVIPAGPDAGRTGGSWIVWTNKEDTYVAELGLGGTWKVSLHADAAWRLAITSEHARSPNPVLPRGHDRAPWKFNPTSFADGHRLALVIGVQRGAMLPPDGVKPWGVHIPVEDRWDRMTFAGIYMTEPGVDLQVSDSVVGGPLPLASGRRVWVTTRAEEVQGEPETGIVSSMIMPLTPETDGVLAPTLSLVGVRLG